MTGPTVDWEKLGRYLAGESTPDEAAEMRRWLEAHPSDAAVIAALDAATKGARPTHRVDVEAALRNVKTRAQAPAPIARRPWRVAGYAAAAVAVLTIGVIVTRRTADRPGSIVAAPTDVAFATGIGERDSVVLADGSRVLLGPASRIRVRGRDVELSGEAYFRVVHDSARPFTVHAGDAVIRDIGTEFSVHSDPAEPVRVIVKEGAVAFMHRGDSVTLERGDVGVVEASRVAAKRGAATPDDLAWTRGQLVFRNASVGELTADLRRWYGVELRVMDTTLMRRHVTSKPFVSESRTQVLDVIALIWGARVEWRGDTAIVRTAARSR